jgi:hypothetical protein
VFTYTNYPDLAGTPATIAAIAPTCSKSDSGPRGHVSWVNGSVFNSGVTTAMPPNSKVLVPGYGTNPYDLVTTDENQGGRSSPASPPTATTPAASMP